MMESAQHEMTVLRDDKLLCISIRGTLHYAPVRGIMGEASRVAAEHGCTRFFYDFREAELSMTTTELYFLPRELPDLRFHRIGALIRKDAHLDDWQFFETVGQNNGIQMQFFTEEEKAIKWLTA